MVYAIASQKTERPTEWNNQEDPRGKGQVNMAVGGVVATPQAEMVGDGVVVSWPDGTKGRFHNFWLRENCFCPRCTHPDAWERMVDYLDIPLDIAPVAVDAEPGGLRLAWPSEVGPGCDGTFYQWGWLDRHRTETEARRARTHRPTSWTGSDLTMADVTVPYGQFATTDNGLLAVCENLATVGIAMVTEVPIEENSVLAVCERMGFVEETHFGRSWDVRSKPQAENLAYTSYRLRPHNDLAARRHLPGIQFLHCMVNDANGGESVLVDSIAVTERFRADDPDGFEMLATVPITFSQIHEQWHLVNRGTVIELDVDGDVVGTRLHAAVMGPVDVAPNMMGDFYRAYRGLLAIAADPAMHLTFRLEAGMCQIFDNARIVHARQAFDPSTGARHLRGAYINRDELWSRLEILRRKGADFRSGVTDRF